MRYVDHDTRGFTLIELLIVVTVIGMLAAIAIPNMATAQRRARYSRAAGDTKVIITQPMVMMSDNNQLPITDLGLTDAHRPVGRLGAQRYGVYAPRQRSLGAGHPVQHRGGRRSLLSV
ncbi:MAG: competence type IV pilus major pilin ComGC [Candidatus Methylomirabilales bacterium]